ncbi:unnamed protein product [Durusdinium trenchii]|uniref:Uncharacterized protein n=1 Tax=Durusdinium trenchii TaxID=1381693 RepID=A0ABP0PCN4_9DINO
MAPIVFRSRSGRGGGGGSSPASTVPASAASVERAKASARRERLNSTPPARVKRSNTGVSQSSAPKLPRRIQSEEILRDAAGKLKSPATVYYSPECPEQIGVQDPPAPETRKGRKRKEPEPPANANQKVDPPPKPPRAKATAVKAKAKASAKSATSPKVETPPPATSRAVQQALNRKSTSEIHSHQPSPHSPSAASAAEDSEGAGAEQPAGDSDGELTLEQVKARKAAHARFMRFSRSLKSPRILSACAHVLHHGVANSQKLGILYEQWAQCDGHWTESSLYKELRVSVRHRRRGARRWLTLHELTLKYGSERVARRIAEHKLADAELARTQVRFHPDAPGDEDLRQFLVWDIDAEEDVHDTVTSTMIDAVERDQSPKHKTKDNKRVKGKPNKKKDSSDSSSDADGSHDDDSSSSDPWMNSDCKPLPPFHEPTHRRDT